MKVSFVFFPTDRVVTGSPPLSLPQFKLTKKFVRNFLETLAIQLGDTKMTLPLLIEHFEIEGDDEEANQVQYVQLLLIFCRELMYRFT